MPLYQGQQPVQVQVQQMQQQQPRSALRTGRRALLQQQLSGSVGTGVTPGRGAAGAGAGAGLGAASAASGKKVQFQGSGSGAAGGVAGAAGAEAAEPAEDDGILLSVCLRLSTGKSFLAVVDAKTMQLLAEVQTSVHTPLSYHGNYYSQREMIQGQGAAAGSATTAAGTAASASASAASSDSEIAPAGKTGKAAGGPSAGSTLVKRK